MLSSLSSRYSILTVLLLLLVLADDAAASATTGGGHEYDGQVIGLMPNCTTSCGGVRVPYPFGIEPGCYLGESFK